MYKPRVIECKLRFYYSKDDISRIINRTGHIEQLVDIGTQFSQFSINWNIPNSFFSVNTISNTMQYVTNAINIAMQCSVVSD